MQILDHIRQNETEIFRQEFLRLFQLNVLKAEDGKIAFLVSVLVDKIEFFPAEKRRERLRKAILKCI